MLTKQNLSVHIKKYLMCSFDIVSRGGMMTVELLISNPMYICIQWSN
jgi:hypothetical protein